MMEDAVPGDIDKLWVDRASVKSQWLLCAENSNAAIVLGPPNSGKYSLVHRIHEDTHSALPRSGRRTANRTNKWEEFRRNPKSRVSIVINLPDFRPIRNILEFYYGIRTNIIERLAIELGFDADRFERALLKGGPQSLLASHGFLPAIARILNEDGQYSFDGKVLIFMCGLQYVNEFNRREFFRRLRQFLDQAIGDVRRECFQIVMTSVVDIYMLTYDELNICSPLNCLRRIIIEDMTREEHKALLAVCQSNLRIRLAEPEHLYNLTRGDVYLTKVLLGICRSNIIQTPHDFYQKAQPITNEMIDKAVESIITIEREASLPPFRVLLDFLDNNEEVREVAQGIWQGQAQVPMMDTTGVYTVPESSGAVKKSIQDGKYVYVSRNPIYDRLIEKYFVVEGKKADRILSAAMGGGEADFGLALTSAIKHELGSPIVALKASVDLIKRHAIPNPAIQQAIELINRAAGNLGLVATLLERLRGDYSRDNWVYLNDFLTEFARIFESHFRSRNINLRLRCDPEVGGISIETSAFNIALIQMLTNARDALQEKGRGYIDIITEMKKDRTVAVSIKDDAIGMSAEVLAKIANPGFTTKDGHSGLGMPLLRAAADRLGAKLDIQSSPAEGTVVTLLLKKEKV